MSKGKAYGGKIAEAIIMAKELERLKQIAASKSGLDGF